MPTGIPEDPAPNTRYYSKYGSMLSIHIVTYNDSSHVFQWITSDEILWRQVLEDFKGSIPPHRRKFEEESKRWLLTVSTAELRRWAFARFLDTQMHWAQVHVPTGTRPAGSSGSKTGGTAGTKSDRLWEQMDKYFQTSASSSDTTYNFNFTGRKSEKSADGQSADDAKRETPKDGGAYTIHTGYTASKAKVGDYTSEDLRRDYEQYEQREREKQKDTSHADSRPFKDPSEEEIAAAREREKWRAYSEKIRQEAEDERLRQAAEKFRAQQEKREADERARKEREKREREEAAAKRAREEAARKKKAEENAAWERLKREQQQRSRPNYGSGPSYGSSAGYTKSGTTYAREPYQGYSSDLTVLCVTIEAPPEVIKAAYKALIKLYHPDVNKTPGANDKSVALTRAWARIRPTLPAD